MRKIVNGCDFSKSEYSEEEVVQLNRKLNEMCKRMLRCCHLPEAYFQEMETYLCNICYKLIHLDKKPKGLDNYCYVAIRNSIYHLLKSKKDWNKKNISLDSNDDL
jgi:hypothetical protein